MIDYQRILWNDNGTEKDISVELNEWRSGTVNLPIASADDYIYIGCDLPFNHKYIEVQTANDQASAVSIDMWFSNDWEPAVDVIDRTESSGRTWAVSGIIEWKTNRLKGWDREQDSEDVTGVSAVGLYDLYWIRLSFSGDLAAGTVLSYIGNKFSSDATLYDYYPDLNNSNLKEAFETGKTTWDDQHFIAAEMIVRDLKSRSIVMSQNQILDYEKFREPAVHKVAELIYWGLGRQFEDNRLLARGYYNDAMNVKFFNVDLNRDANLSEIEKTISTGYMTR